MINVPAKRGKRQEGCGIPNTEPVSWIPHWKTGIQVKRDAMVSLWNAATMPSVVSIVQN